MPGFVKPTRKVVNIEDAFGELIGKKLIKDLHDNEEICPVCHGTGLRIEDNPYGLSDDPDKRAGQFPYKHQSIRFCPNCYNGVVRFCPDCGKQIPRCRTLCDCDAVVQRRQQEENRKEKERLEKAEKHEPNALGSLFTMAQSDFYSHNEGYFSCWEDFFDSWNEDREEFTGKPLYVWGTEEVEMSFDASSIVSNACEDMYEDAYDDIGADAVAEIRDLNEAGRPKSDQDILDEAFLLIHAFCAERNFKIYYTRTWNHNGVTIFDVGSHTEFFHLTPAVSLYADTTSSERSEQNG